MQLKLLLSTSVKGTEQCFLSYASLLYFVVVQGGSTVFKSVYDILKCNGSRRALLSHACFLKGCYLFDIRTYQCSPACVARNSSSIAI